MSRARRERATPTLGAHLRGCSQWGCFFTVVFFLTFPFWAPALLAAFKFVLEGLNNFGSGR